MVAAGSVGIAIATPGVAADELIVRADAEMYAAKESANHRTVVYAVT